jgi:hypothetical protein
MKEYKHMPFPWTSKSKIKTRDYCDYTFYLQYVKHEKRKSRRDSVEGTNMHMVFAKFFKEITPKHMFKSEFCDPLVPTHRHPLRRFIYESCMNWVKPEQRKFDKYKNILRNFATIETERWLYLNVELKGQKGEIFDLFKPILIEDRLEHDPTHLFGTIDRVNVELMPDHSKKVCVYDYKTGNVPKQIREHTENTLQPFDWTIPSSYMKEIHFYGLLYLLKAGWTLSDELMAFLNDPEWWFVKKDNMGYKKTKWWKRKYLTSLGKKYKPFKAGRVLKKGDILVGYYFLNGEKAYRPIKEFGMPSLKSVYLSVNDLRSVQHNNYYVKHPRYVFDKEVCSLYKKCDRAELCEKELKEYLKEHGE